MKFRPTRILAVLTFGLALTLLFPGYAIGQPTTDIRAKAAQLEKDLNASNQQVAALAQQLQAAQAKVDEADARVKVAQDGINRIKSIINGRAASIYKLAGAAGPLDALNAQDAQDLTTRSKYTDLANSSDESLVQQLAASRAELDKARAQVSAERDAVAAAKAEADAAASTQQRLLDQVKGDIEAELRNQTAARAAGAPKVSGPGPLGSGGSAHVNCSGKWKSSGGSSSSGSSATMSSKARSTRGSTSSVRCKSRGPLHPSSGWRSTSHTWRSEYVSTKCRSSWTWKPWSTA